MANVIIRDPSDRQMEAARAIARLKTDKRFAERVNTEASDRVRKKMEAERPIRPSDIAQMKMIPFDTLAMRLRALNPRITFTSLPDAKVAFGLDAPTGKEARDWEASNLSAAERYELRKVRGYDGPRRFLVAASRGWISPYTDLISSGYPPQIVCRSLKSILKVLIAHGAFTWEEAEREFGFRLQGPGTEVKKERIPVTPRQWAEERPVTEV